MLEHWDKHGEGKNYLPSAKMCEADNAVPPSDDRKIFRKFVRN
jgi:hypothetical protein